MNKKLVEVLAKQLKYSPNGWDNALARKGEEIELDERVAKGLIDLDPPMVALVDENFTPKVFHSEEDVVEAKVEEIVIIEDEETAVAEAEVELAIAVEKEEEIVSLEVLEKIIDDAPDGADEIEIDIIYKAVQKSGKWYNVLKLDEKVNDKGIARDKV
ncbi:unnamed protein product, partial [marine sediment metagenome]